MNSSPEAAAWHVARWGPLAWIETGVKSCGFLCAYLALASSITTGWSTPRGVRIVELALIGTATVGLLAAIGDRLLEREIVSVARPLIDGLRNSTIAHDTRPQTLVPFELTSFDTAAQADITAARPPR